MFEVELCKDNKGLGITIAGYVGEENEGKGKVKLSLDLNFSYQFILFRQFTTFYYLYIF